MGEAYYAKVICTCISQLSLNYYVLTNDLKVSGADNNKGYFLLSYVSTVGQLEPCITCLQPGTLAEASGLSGLTVLFLIAIIFQLKWSSLMLNTLCVLAGKKKKINGKTTQLLLELLQVCGHIISKASFVAKPMSIEHGNITPYREGNIKLGIIECTTACIIHLTATTTYEFWLCTQIEIRQLWSRNCREKIALLE